MGCPWLGRLIGVEGIRGFCLRRWGGVLPLRRRRCRFGFLLFSLVFAFCLRASSVAPVGLPLRWHLQLAFAARVLGLVCLFLR